jgi:polyisoprenoid-binding protein YceI
MRKHSLFLSAALIVCAATGLAQTWTPDKAHSMVSFSILHMGLSKVRGHFGNIGGTIQINDSDITKSVVNVTVDVSTIDTGEPARDRDLKSANFFDVEHFPAATFVSTSIARHGNVLDVGGNFTLHGVTKPVVLYVEGPTGPVPGMDHKPHSAFSATTTISRTAFGIGTKYPATVVGDEVSLTIDLDLAKQ